MQKHPHVRGEDLDAAWYSVQTLETPPRAWGRQRPMMLKISVSRNTPTCVGKTEGNYYANDMLEKHPHVRGEDVVVQSDCKATTETPPRAWGRLTVCRKLNRFPRNTPTCVGKTGSVARFARSLKKHPHVRGEDLLHFSVRIQWMETPPRAWGRR